MPIRVALAEDSFLVREALQQLLLAERRPRARRGVLDADELRPRSADTTRRRRDRHPHAAVDGRRRPPRRGRAPATASRMGVVVLSPYFEPRYAARSAGRGLRRPRLPAQGACPQRAPAHRDDRGRRRRRLGHRPEGRRSRSSTRARAARRSPLAGLTRGERDDPRRDRRRARATRRSPATLSLTKRARREAHQLAVHEARAAASPRTSSRRVKAVAAVPRRRAPATARLSGASEVPRRRRARRSRPGTAASP